MDACLHSVVKSFNMVKSNQVKLLGKDLEVHE